jgi:hypothetical protein
MAALSSIHADLRARRVQASAALVTCDLPQRRRFLRRISRVGDTRLDRQIPAGCRGIRLRGRAARLSLSRHPADL